MSVILVTSKGMRSGSPGIVTFIVDIVAVDDLGNAWNLRDTAIDVIPAETQIQTSQRLRDEARALVLAAGGPDIPSANVVTPKPEAPAAGSNSASPILSWVI